jgi:peptidoglycan/xylan/chitin deacetylase (PgdA/CDA1 family)
MILLSFDIEEFDMPLEYGKEISFEDQISISAAGTRRILDLLTEHEIKATFFCTATFALSKPELIKEMVAAGHELASHGYYHSKFEPADLYSSKKVLEDIGETSVKGYRMARMMPVDSAEIKKAGYLYNSSINPTWLPGRYNNLKVSRNMFWQDGVLQLPASVTPGFRFPLFWLSMHNLPLGLYERLCLKTYKADGYLNIYFHPWEFTDLSNKTRFGFPGYVSKNSGDAMVNRMDRLIRTFKKHKLPFGTIADSVFVQGVNFSATKKAAL